MIELLDKIRSLNTSELVRQAVVNNRQKAEDLNRSQMDQGINSKGTEITPEYTRFTKIMKRKKGQPSDRVTLEDTGSFKRKMFLKDDSSGFENSSSDGKTKKLTDKYGPDIFGLTQENKEELSEAILPELQRLVKEKLV